MKWLEVDKEYLDKNTKFVEKELNVDKIKDNIEDKYNNINKKE